jgi:uncharacterized phage protein (TIGR01671 family)
MSKKYRPTNEEMNDLDTIVSDTLDKLCKMADRHNIDRNELVNYYVNVITGIAEFANIRNCETNHTNADRIRTMTDEELAEWLTNMCDFEKNEEPYKSIYNLDTEKEEEIHDSYGDLLIWLQSEAEIGETMEDRYLFKAKRVDNGKWIIGSYVNCCYPNKENETGHFILEYPNKYHEIYTPTLCQCTGLEDKNGNLIWENDILVGYLDDNYPQNATYEMVIWNKSGFCTKGQGSNDISKFCEFDQKYFEVCGNIIDNPELIESEE